MAIFNQENRMLVIGTPLGKDVLLLSGFTGTEELSRLFAYQLDLLSERDDIVPRDIVGQNVSWAVVNVDKQPRYFNGVVSRFTLGGSKVRGMRTYRAEVVPWLWFLTRTTNCRIFQNLSTPEIVQSVFTDLGFTDFQLSLTGSYQPRDYCVQYRETAFNFVSRLLEEEGIFYFFRHQDGKHTLVLADSSSAFQDVPETPVFFAPAGALSPNHVTDWNHEYAYRSGRCSHTDYNFQTPATNLLTSTDTLVELANVGSFELFDYPGRYQHSPEGNTFIRTRMQEEETPYEVAQGTSECCTFTPGGKFTLEGHTVDAENKAYVLTSVRHVATEASYDTGGGASEYKNSFTCIPATVSFRPARLSRKPFVQGPQTAVVVGPPGEEIYSDPYGRVKVQFFWDRYGKMDANSSCWIRVSQNWAGRTWGLIMNPRIGQEVIVDFLEGDPDRPLITGRVYNADQMPPYTLPTNQTQTGIKTRSSLGGTTNNFNELRFEDKKGSEDIFFHAEKDFHREVENDDSLIVGSAAAPDGSQFIQIWKNRSEIVQTGDEFVEIAKGNRAHKIKQNDNLTIEGSQTIAITQDRNELIKSGNETVVIASGSRNHNIKQNDLLIIEGNETIQVTQNYTRIVKSGNETVAISTGNRSHSVQGNDTLIVQGNQQQQITGNRQIAVTSGNLNISVAAGMYTLEAATGIELKVGNNAIRIDPTGITLEGTLINIDAAAVMTMAAPVVQRTAQVLFEDALLSGYDAILMSLGGILTDVTGLALAHFGGALTLVGEPGAWMTAGLTGLEAAENVAFAVAPVIATEEAGGTVTREEKELMVERLLLAAAGPAAVALKPVLKPLAKASLGQAKIALNKTMGGLLSKCSQKAAAESEAAARAAQRANALTQAVSKDSEVLRKSAAAATAGQRSALHNSVAAKLAAGKGPAGLSPAQEAARAAQSAKAFHEAAQEALKNAPREAVLEAEKAAQAAKKAADAAKNAQRIAKYVGPPTKALKVPKAPPRAPTPVAPYRSSIKTPTSPVRHTPPNKPLPPTPADRLQRQQPQAQPIDELPPLRPEDVPPSPHVPQEPEGLGPDVLQRPQPEQVPIDEPQPLRPEDVPPPPQALQEPEGLGPDVPQQPQPPQVPIKGPPPLKPPRPGKQPPSSPGTGE